jgi:hypothetical protein
MKSSLLNPFRIGQRSATLSRTVRRAALTMALLSGASMAHAQLTTADILGTVTDPTGAAIPNAQVQVRNLGTNDTRNGSTDGSGNFSFTTLLPGRYTVTVTAPGFKVSSTTGLAIEAGDRARADAHLQLGATTETITVEASTPLLQADNATVSSTVTSQSVQDLPLNGRNFVQLAQIVPGANEGPGNGLSSGARPDDRRQSSSFSVNGQDDILNNFVIDGFDNNERIIGTSGVRPNVEGIQEISIQTNTYAPEAGRTAGGVINITTRSGTNTFHGSVYEYFRNDVLDARQVLQSTGRKPELRQNQFGGSFGGPIWRDRTFFFGDYEGLRQVTGLTYQSTVPTIDEYNNINSLSGGSPAALVAAGNGTAGHMIDPVALNYLKLFPKPTNSNLTNNFVISPNRTQTSNTFDTRIDHRFNARNAFFGRYTYNNVKTFTPPALGVVGGYEISGGRYIFAGPATDSAQQYAFDYTHIFTDNLLVDLRAGFTRMNNLSLPLNYGLNADDKVGFGANMNFNPLANVLTPISFGPFADIGDGAYVPLQNIDNDFQYSGTLSWTLGNHGLKFGGGLIRRQARNLQSAFPAGQYGFNLITDNCAPGTSYVNGACVTPASDKQRQDNQLASSLVGAFSSNGRNYDLIPPDFRTWEPSAFVQDSWKVIPKLTLTYGARYDVFTPFTEAHSRISNFDFNKALTLNSITAGQALLIANQGGVDGHAGIRTDFSNFAPRVGFSYSPINNTVIRGGYGLSFFPGNYAGGADLKNAPFVSVYSPNCIATVSAQIQTALGVDPRSSNPDCATIAGATTTFDQGLPLPAAQSISSSALSFNAEDPKFRSALFQQFNLQIQEQFGANVLTVGYVGNIGSHEATSFGDINVPKPGDTVTINPTTGSPNASSARPLSGILPNLNGVHWLPSEAVSNYNALQMSYQRRFVHGLAFDGNYTWAKALGDVNTFSQSNDGTGNADWTHTRQIDYGVLSNDIQNRFALSVNYQFAAGHKFAGINKLLLGGWQANTITVWQSGKPFTILNGGSGSDGSYSNRATPINNAGNDRPNQIAGAGGAKAIGSSGAFWFNPNAFAPQTLGTIGNFVRNSLFGPHYRKIDFSLFKNFAVTEHGVLQFRAEVFNIANTPSYILTFGSGNVSLGNSLFGHVTDVDPNYNPRLMQFALKYNF